MMGTLSALPTLRTDSSLQTAGPKRHVIARSDSSEAIQLFAVLDRFAVAGTTVSLSSLAAVDLTSHQRDGALIDPAAFHASMAAKLGSPGWYPAPARQPCALRKFAVELSALAALSRLPVP